ncbi:MAG: ribonuclease HII [Clostridia bacterium]
MKISELKNNIQGMCIPEALAYARGFRDSLDISSLLARIEKEQERLRRLSRYETALYAVGVQSIAGIDEAGRGPLAGPVSAAAVILKPGCMLFGIDDSKKLTPKKRDILYEAILRECICHCVVLVDNLMVDAMNIHEAAKKAMCDAVKGLSMVPDHLLIDAVELKDLPFNQTPLIKGDSLSVSIAAASILAKVTRDRVMDAFHIQYPHYNFLSNKGYGTKEHMEAIKRYGLTPIHRTTFVKNIV